MDEQHAPIEMGLLEPQEALDRLKWTLGTNDAELEREFDNPSSNKVRDAFFAGLALAAPLAGDVVLACIEEYTDMDLVGQMVQEQSE